MRKRAMMPIVVLLVCMAFSDTAGAGDKSKLQWYSFEKGLAEAKKGDKKLLIDVYTDWCSWCKRMDADTYADPDVAAYLQKHYVVVKLNAESRTKQAYQGQEFTEQELAGAFGVTGYPTTLFLKPDGEAITAYPGYADAARFKTVLSFIAGDHYLNTKFEEFSQKK